MSSNMEVEETSSGERVAVHPLALVHMSDHYTRVTTGGSPLSRDSAVVGILFGQQQQQQQQQQANGTASSIVDAEDIPLDDDDLTKAVALHQAVFPQNAVVGCYRVVTTTTAGAAAEPTADDIRQVQVLQQTFGGNTGSSSSSSAASSLYFGLLQVDSNTNDKKNSQDIDDDDDNLPLQLFTLHNNNNVLVAVDDWHLTTSAAAERIAVERVLRDKPASDAHDEIQQAWMALDARLQQILEYLPTTISNNGNHPNTSEHLELWRQVQGLLAQAHLLRTNDIAVNGSRSSNNNNVLLPQQVAVLAKTVDAIAWYTDKFRMVHEVKGR